MAIWRPETANILNRNKKELVNLSINMPLNVSKVFKMHVSINQIMKMYIYILFGFVSIAIYVCIYTFLNVVIHF